MQTALTSVTRGLSKRLIEGKFRIGTHTGPVPPLPMPTPTADATPAGPEFRAVRPRHQAPVGFGGHDDADEFREKGALPDLCAAAVAVGIGCALRVHPGYHTWQFAATAFTNALPWMAQRLHVS